MPGELLLGKFFLITISFLLLAPFDSKTDASKRRKERGRKKERKTPLKVNFTSLQNNLATMKFLTNTSLFYSPEHTHICITLFSSLGHSHTLTNSLILHSHSSLLPTSSTVRKSMTDKTIAPHCHMCAFSSETH